MLILISEIHSHIDIHISLVFVPTYFYHSLRRHATKVTGFFYSVVTKSVNTMHFRGTQDALRVNTHIWREAGCTISQSQLHLGVSRGRIMRRRCDL